MPFVQGFREPPKKIVFSFNLTSVARTSRLVVYELAIQESDLLVQGATIMPSLRKNHWKQPELYYCGHRPRCHDGHLFSCKFRLEPDIHFAGL